MKFIDLHTHSILSTGVDTPLRMHRHAKDLKIDIGFCDGIKSRGYTGVELCPKSKGELKKGLGKYKNKVDYVLVSGDTEKVVRSSLDDRRVDILNIDYNSGNTMNHTLAKKAKENNIAIEVSLKDLIKAKRFRRARVIKNVRKNGKLSRKYGFDLIVTSGAKSRYDLRSGDQVYELLRAIGLEKEAERMMYQCPMDILKKNSEVKDEGYIMRGVKVIE